MPLMLKGDVVFLHAPKTGGNWVTAMLEEQNLVQFPFGSKHADAAHLLVPPYDSGSNKRIRNYWNYAKALQRLRKARDYRFFYTVRNPFTWYESWFKYQSAERRKWRDWGRPPNPFYWHISSPLNGLGAESFPEFMENVLDHVPGYVSQLYGRYAAAHTPHVMKNETLAEDLCRILGVFDLPFDRDRIMGSGKIGESPDLPVEWDPLHREKVRVFEAPAFKKYGYDTE